MILFDSSYLKIEFKNVPCRHVLATWNGSPGDDGYKTGCSKILQCCHENDIWKLLSDIRLQERVSAHAGSFGQNAIAEYVVRHGRFYHAVVLSTEVFVEFDIPNFDRSAGRKNYIQQFFSNQQDALTWLQETEL